MSTIVDDTRAAIEGRVASNWGNTRIRWPNVAYTPEEGKTWLAVDIRWGDGFIATKNGRNRLIGVLFLTVFAPVGRGDGAISELADDARDLVNRLEVSGVRFVAPSGPSFSTETATKWRQAQVTCGFSVEEEV
jgi:hypothetical protein